MEKKNCQALSHNAMSVNIVLENLKDKVKYKKYHIIVMVSSFDMRNLEKDSEKNMKKSLV